jgi:hypothetical protein
MDEQLVPLETQQEETQQPAEDQQPAASEIVVSELEDDEWQD